MPPKVFYLLLLQFPKQYIPTPAGNFPWGTGNIPDDVLLSYVERSTTNQTEDGCHPPIAVIVPPTQHKGVKY
jgi:hypothetical protein